MQEKSFVLDSKEKKEVIKTRTRIIWLKGSTFVTKFVIKLLS